MSRTVASLVLIVLAGFAGNAQAGKFVGAQFNGQNLTHSNNNMVTFSTPPTVCVTHGHHQCPNPLGSTIPDCHGGHMGPNGVMIQCK